MFMKIALAGILALSTAFIGCGGDDAAPGAKSAPANSSSPNKQKAAKASSPENAKRAKAAKK
jgi:hypothetical protein